MNECIADEPQAAAQLCSLEKFLLREESMKLAGWTVCRVFMNTIKGRTKVGEAFRRKQCFLHGFLQNIFCCSSCEQTIGLS